MLPENMLSRGYHDDFHELISFVLVESYQNSQEHK